MLKNKPALYFPVKEAYPPQMPNTRNEEIDHSTQASIVAVALVQFLGSLPFLYVCGIALWGTVLVTHDFAKPAALIVVFGFPVLFGLLAVATSIGLAFLQEWARKATIFLATAPALGCVLLLILRPPSIMPRAEPDEQQALMTVGSGLLPAIFLCLLVILIPIGVWWLVLFTRPSVKAQFQSGKVTRR
jgi:hypothetical protein